MPIHYDKITSKTYTKVADLEPVIFNALVYFEEELQEGFKDLSMGGRIEGMATKLPGIFGQRYSQYQEVEAILEYLNIEMSKIRAIMFKHYNENYNVDLTAQNINRYIDGEPEINRMAKLVNRFALVRNNYDALFKGLENKSFQLNNVVKMRVAGLEDVEIPDINVRQYKI